MTICSMVDTSINKTDLPNGLASLNHKNVTTWRVSHNVANRKNSDNPVVNDDITHRKCRLTKENPPTNAEIETPGAVGRKVPEIRPVKQLSFVSM